MPATSQRSSRSAAEPLCLRSCVIERSSQNTCAHMLNYISNEVIERSSHNTYAHMLKQDN